MVRAVCFVPPGLVLAGCLALASPANAERYRFATIDLPGQYASEATGIDDRNEVVGYFESAGVSTVTNFKWANGVATSLPDTAGYFVGLNDRRYTANNLATRTTRTVGYYNIQSGATLPIATNPDYSAIATAINATSIVIGVLEDKHGHYAGFEAHGKKTVVLSLPHASFFSPAAINDSGLIAGTYQSGSPAVYHGFTAMDGSITSFDVPGAGVLGVNSVSSAGAIGGYYSDAKQVEHGFVLSGGTVTSYDFPGASGTTIVAFGPGGLLIGTYFDSQFNEHAFVLLGGQYYGIRFPGAVTTHIAGTNAGGGMAGYIIDTTGKFHAFVATCPVNHSPCLR